ncbi:MAG: V-type ATP synthase subunit E [Candidatus Diapherotrites archaeon]
MQGIMEKIKSDAQKRAKAIETECERETARIKSQAQAKAQEIIAMAREKAKSEAETAKKREIARANLNAQKEIALLLDKKLEEIISNASKTLQLLRKQKNFAKKFNSMVTEAIKEMPAGTITIQVSPEDAKLLQKNNKSAKIETVKNMSPGAIIKSADESIKIDCTFAALLEEKKQELKKELLKEIGE